VAERRRETLDERRARRAEIDDPAVVFEAAARFLETRPRSVQEVRRRLTDAGYRPELIERAIDRFTEIGVLDDAVFAAQWVESRDRANPRGEHALIVELRQKGIDATTIASTLRARREAAVQWEDRSGSEPGPPAALPDVAAAERLLARHARALGRVADPRMRRQKAYALLARHGFDPDTCREVAATIIEDAGPASVADGGADESTPE
jgi:regulatory protein